MVNSTLSVPHSEPLPLVSGLEFCLDGFEVKDQALSWTDVLNDDACLTQPAPELEPECVLSSRRWGIQEVHAC